MTMCRRKGHDWSGQPFMLNGHIAWKCQRWDCDRIRILDKLGQPSRIQYMSETPHSDVAPVAPLMSDAEITFAIANALCEISCCCCSRLMMPEEESMNGQCLPCHYNCDPDESCS